MAGSIPGSDYYLVGGITELNFNIRSRRRQWRRRRHGHQRPSTARPAASLYVMNVGLDLRLVDTNTLEVVDVISYQKQIIGHQISAGVFDFLGTNFFDASVGESALEPIQLAVRSVIERAVLEMTSRLYRIPANACDVNIGTDSDPLADATDRQHAVYQQAPAPAPVAAAHTTTAMKEEKYNDTSRQEPYRYYSSPDASDGGLRGRVD